MSSWEAICLLHIWTHSLPASSVFLSGKRTASTVPEQSICDVTRSQVSDTVTATASHMLPQAIRPQRSVPPRPNQLVVASSNDAPSAKIVPQACRGWACWPIKLDCPVGASLQARCEMETRNRLCRNVPDCDACMSARFSPAWRISCDDFCLPAIRLVAQLAYLVVEPITNQLDQHVSVQVRRICQTSRTSGGLEACQKRPFFGSGMC